MTKQFTKKEEGKIRRLHKAGKSQYQIGIALRTRYENIGLFLRKGKAAPTEYRRDVNKVKATLGCSDAKARKLVSGGEKFGKRKAKRMHKIWKSQEDREATMARLRATFSGKELGKEIEEELEEYLYGDTAK